MSVLKLEDRSTKRPLQSAIVAVGTYTGTLAATLTVILLALTLALSSGFSWTNTFNAWAPLALAALASTPAAIVGRFDITVSPVMALSTVIYAGYLYPNGLGGLPGAIIIIVMGALLGAANNFVAIALRISSLIVTLSLMFILTGLTLTLAPVPIAIGRDTWVSGFSGTFGPLPGGLVAIAVPLILWFLIRKSALGRNMYAVGGNDITAYASGIRVVFVRTLAFAFGGAVAGLGGLVLVGLTNSADPRNSSAYTLLALSAVAIGGTSFFGGIGGVVGSVLGSSVLFLIQGLLGQLGFPSAALPFMFGLALAVSVILGVVIEKATVRLRRSFA